MAGLIAALLTVSALAVGCGNSGSTTTTATAGTSKQAYVLVPVLNDTQSTVKFIQCLATCAELHEGHTIQAGGRTSILATNDNVAFSYLVEDAAGKRLGCLHMQFDHVKSAATVPVSSMTACK